MTKDIDAAMMSMPPGWKSRWCNNMCACMGCANKAGGLTAKGYTYQDWRDWISRNNEDYMNGLSPSKPLIIPHGQEKKMLDEKGHIQCEIEELKIEMQKHIDALKNCTKLVEKNNEKLRKLKMEKENNSTEMTVEELQSKNWYVNMSEISHFIREDENTVRIEGVEYKKVEKPKSPTLYDTLAPQMNTVGFHFNEQQREWICNIVRGWLIDHTVIETEDAERVTFTILKEQLQTPK